MQVLTAGQELAFDYQGDLFLLKPVSMMLASSQGKSAPQGCSQTRQPSPSSPPLATMVSLLTCSVMLAARDEPELSAP